MTLLHREDLLSAVTSDALDERLVVMPILDLDIQIGPGTIDLRLGSEFIEVDLHAEKAIDPVRESPAALRRRERKFDVPYGESFVLHPHQFVLGATLEFVRMPSHLGGQVLGRSSWGRLGLVVATAVVVQPCYAGCLTLELINNGNMPILLYPGLRVAQLQVWKLGSPTKAGYGTGEAKYSAPLGPESARLGWEANEVERLEKLGSRLRHA